MATNEPQQQQQQQQWPLKPIKIEPQTPVPADIKCARSIQGHHIADLCRSIGIEHFDLYGKYKAKIDCPPSGLEVGERQRGSYVVVTGVTPTAFGEGKSTTTLGLVQALTAHLGRNSFACIRQPSQGPTFGLKGGAAGGGYSQVWPMDEFNLHLTGDIHAVTAAHNLIAAALDARALHEANTDDAELFRRLVSKRGAAPKFTDAQRRRLAKQGIGPEAEPDQLDEAQRRRFARLDIDPETICINRVIDTNDRFLRRITIGQSATEKFRTRETKFAISVSSELMAILSLAADLNDACRRVERMVVAFSRETRQPITCDDLCVAGAVCALIKDAIKPTLVQTLEGTPVLVHCGPFANIAHGNSSIIADKLALKLVGSQGFVVTEAGFASDIGFEKFMNIKCRTSGLMPDCAVLVTTLRAIKLHGRELLEQPEASDELAIENGLINLRAHIANITKNFEVPCVVALNRFAGDSQTELERVAKLAAEAGATDCRIADNWARGGAGALELAQSVIDTCSRQRSGAPGAKVPRLLYESKGASIEEKITKVATRVYGAARVDFPESVRERIKVLEANGFGELPVCVAKTQLSISHDPKMKGAPTGYTFPIVDCNVLAGAGFVYALAGEISTMPGLPTRPGFFDISIDPETGLVEGLF